MMERQYLLQIQSALAWPGDASALTGLSISASRQPEDAMIKRISNAMRRRITDLAVRQYSAALRRYISHYVRNPSDVRDVEQNTWLKYFQSVNEKYTDENVKAYLFRIAWCQIAEYWKRKNKDNAHFESIEGEDGMPANTDSLSAEDPKEHEQNRQWILESVKGMSKKMATCVCLHRQGRSAREIAKTLGISEDAVRQHISRARKLLKQLLQGVGP